MTPDLLHVPDSLTMSKIPRNKRKNKDTKEPAKPLYGIPKQVPKESKEPRGSDREKDPDFEPEPKKQRKEKDKLDEKQYHPLEQVANADVENVREVNNVLQEEVTTDQLR